MEIAHAATMVTCSTGKIFCTASRFSWSIWKGEAESYGMKTCRAKLDLFG
jgi:hypothetical protein